ncbi:hypothetical protein GIB64_02370 [Pseudomonas lactis]|uniref:hypothetical protein n=1 Tax=Pseudomonas TaxID=286 RepID=UPI000BB64C2E|nr:MULTISPECIES: hypothetical protein [Pseudomonas]MBA5956263.1 hypothetical protein [Pseudomonas lactis]PRW80111.1 hypothetical protein C7A12_02755 [Pseudomonas fluorescens]PRW80886.1 hypothetical protein C7A13_06630 [Pseudomonas fluorescens]
MTYVREQTSAELAAHMHSLKKMAGWFDPLADRLWQEVEALKAENERLHNLPTRNVLIRDREKLIEQRNELKAEIAGLRTGYEAYERVNAELKAENEALKKRIDDMSPFKGAPLTGPDLKCLACGGYHYGLQGLPCPNMRITASAALGQGEQS